MAESHREEIAKLEALYASHPTGRVFVHLAEACRKAGEYERARNILEEGLARHPDAASAYVVQGRLLKDLGEAVEAESAFRRVLELDTGNLVALRGLGDLALADGRHAEALACYRDLLARNPSSEELRALVLETERSAPDPVIAAEPPLVGASAAPGDTGEATVAEPEFGTVALGEASDAGDAHDEGEPGEPTLPAEEPAAAVLELLDSAEPPAPELVGGDLLEAIEDAGLPASESEAVRTPAGAGIAADEPADLDRTAEPDLDRTAEPDPDRSDAPEQGRPAEPDLDLSALLAAAMAGPFDLGQREAPPEAAELDVDLQVHVDDTDPQDATAPPAQLEDLAFEDTSEASRSGAADRDGEPEVVPGPHVGFDGWRAAAEDDVEVPASALDVDVGADMARWMESVEAADLAAPDSPPPEDDEFASGDASRDPEPVAGLLASGTDQDPAAWPGRNDLEDGAAGLEDEAAGAGVREVSPGYADADPAAGADPAVAEAIEEEPVAETLDEAAGFELEVVPGADADVARPEEEFDAAGREDETLDVHEAYARYDAADVQDADVADDVDEADEAYGAYDVYDAGDAYDQDDDADVDQRGAEDTAPSFAGTEEDAADAVTMDVTGSDTAGTSPAAPDFGAAAAGDGWSVEGEGTGAVAQPDEPPVESAAGADDKGSDATVAAGERAEPEADVDETTGAAVTPVDETAERGWRRFAAAGVSDGDEESGDGGLETETIADLYRSQGLDSRAAEVYRALLRRRPDDDALRAKLAEVEQQSKRPDRASPEPTGISERSEISELSESSGAEELDVGEIWLRQAGTTWAGEAAAAAEEPTPYAWTGGEVDADREDEAASAEAIGAYLRDLASWRKRSPVEADVPADVAPEGADAPAAEGGGFASAEEAGVQVTAPEYDVTARGTGSDPVQAAFEEWYGEPAPGAEDPLTGGTAATVDADAAADDATQGEDDDQDDEDLAMFRSWLQSLKK